MEFSGTLAGGLSGSMHFGSDGDTIDIEPILTSGTKIATFTVNAGTEEEVSYDLYAPDTLSWDDITDKPTLFSGVYGDLSSKPTLNGNVINGNMYGQKWDTTQDAIIGIYNNKPVYRRVIENIPSLATGSYIDLHTPDNWDIISKHGIARYNGYSISTDEIIQFPTYINNNIWTRAYYFNDGSVLGSGYPSNGVIYFESSEQFSNNWDGVRFIIDYMIKN